jgi:hypothetical protein
MYDSGQEHHYFVDEPACLNTGQMVVPVRWLEDEKGEVWVEVWEVEADTTAVKFPLAAYSSITSRLELMGFF